MSDHDALRDDLPLLAASDLPPERTALLEAHLPTCPECRADLEDLRATIALLRPEAVPGPDLTGFYDERLAPLLPGTRPRFISLALRAAALLLAFAAGFHVRALLPSHNEDRPPVIEARKESEQERLARAWRASATGESGLSRAALALAAIEQRR